MATTHKSGYTLLKEKYAALEAKNERLQEKLTDVINEKDSFADDCKRLYKEREEWKAKFEGKSSPVFRANEKLSSDLVDTEEKLAFLLEHCPFWVRWMYRKQFEKGGKG